jgi:hypothetical protein
MSENRTLVEVYRATSLKQMIKKNLKKVCVSGTLCCGIKIPKEG